MATPARRHPAILREHVVLVRDGRIAHEGGPREAGNWVYAWIRPAEDARILTVGATGLALAERVQLHLESPEPSIGRVRAEHPEALVGEVVVHGFFLLGTVDRQAVRRALASALLLEAVPAADLASPDDTARTLGRAIAAQLTP